MNGKTRFDSNSPASSARVENVSTWRETVLRSVKGLAEHKHTDTTGASIVS